MGSSPPCPSTVSIRRNPRRMKARPTPVADVPSSSSPPSPSSSDVNQVLSFPPVEIMSGELDQNRRSAPINSNNIMESEALKVFLRVRPVMIKQDSQRGSKGYLSSKSVAVKNAWPKTNSSKECAKEKGKSMTKEIRSCITINGPDSVTIFPPADLNRSKTEIYNGFSHVFSAGSAQDEVYEMMVSPIVEDFISGRSGMLAAMGPSGSGKTYTVFGSNREPGMVPLAIRRICRSSAENSGERSLYLSMFEIYSEKGKVEKLSDLSPDGGSIHLQQSVLKGLKEVLITDASQAESLVASGMSRRATAATNTNNESSRSHCIINIRRAINEINGEIESQSDDAFLTFVDLAGAEREKKTGNQGKRLLEGNFINNTSMVFGLCLRSLLEHQRNPKRPMQKHFQSSLLTRYLRDYLEGKKRMALILTVRPGERDYLDTSFLLRQASPYMEIKFHNMEESANLPHNKRHYQAMPAVEQPKRVKLSGTECCEDDERTISTGPEDICKEDEALHRIKISVLKTDSIDTEYNLTSGVNVDANSGDVKKKRDYEIMEGFAKAFWKVLKEYKQKLKVLEQEVGILTQSLQNERTQHEELRREFNGLKFLHSRCREVEDHATHVKAETGCDAKVNDDFHANAYETALVPDIKDNSSQTISPRGTDILDVHIQMYEQPRIQQPMENDTPSASDQEEEELCLAEGYFCASKNETASGPRIGESSIGPETSPAATVMVDLKIEMCKQPRDGQLEIRDPQFNHEEEEPFIIDGDSCTRTASHLASDACGGHTEIYEQPRDGQSERKGPPTPIKPCLINGDFHSCMNEVASNPGNCDLTDGRSERRDPSINQEEEKSCLVTDGVLCASLCEVASSSGIREYNASTTTSHLPNDAFCLQTELQEQPRDGPGRKVPPSPSNQEEEEPSVIDGVLCASMKEVASHPGIGEPNTRSETSPPATDTSDSHMEVHKQPIDGESERRDAAIKLEEEYPYCDGDFGASMSEAASSPGIDQSNSSTKMTQPVSNIFDLQIGNYVQPNNGQRKGMDHPTQGNHEEEEPCGVSQAAVTESSGTVDGVVSKGVGQEKVIFANRSNLTLAETEEHCIPHGESSIAKRPKRRLMPVSSVLLRDINSVDFKDENEKPMGPRGGRKLAVDDNKRTNGSIALLRLLKNAHR
ncbi:hypothetical protein Dimus_028070 [Dionaea muscipula]